MLPRLHTPRSLTTLHRHFYNDQFCWVGSWSQLFYVVQGPIVFLMVFTLIAHIFTLLALRFEDPCVRSFGSMTTFLLSVGWWIFAHFVVYNYLSFSHYVWCAISGILVVSICAHACVHAHTHTHTHSRTHTIVVAPVPISLHVLARGAREHGEDALTSHFTLEAAYEHRGAGSHAETIQLSEVGRN